MPEAVRGSLAHGTGVDGGEGSGIIMLEGREKEVKTKRKMEGIC